jgi:hypothetical protein
MNEEQVTRGNKILKEIQQLREEQTRAENNISDFRTGSFPKMSYENMVRIRAITGRVYMEQIEQLEKELKEL